MPTFLVPRHVSAHRISAIALYRALLQQSRAAPLPTKSQNELQNIIRNRFKQTIHLHSYRRLRLAFQAGYEAIDHLDAAAAGDESSAEYLTSLLDRAPAKVKSTPPPNPLPKGKRKSKETKPPQSDEHNTAAPKPESELFSRPHPLSQLSGRRHVPVLFSANRVPVLRFKKPQPENLSGFIKNRIEQRQRRHDRRITLGQEAEFARYEDLWDSITADQLGEKKNDNEPSWAQAIEDSIRQTQAYINMEGANNAAMAEKMQGTVDREREAFERERAERRAENRRVREERRRAEGAAG